MTTSLQNIFDESLLLCQAGRFLEARPKLEELLAKSALEPEALGLLALCQAKCGDLSLAEESAQQVILMIPTHRLGQDVLQLIHTEKQQIRSTDYFRNYMLTRSKYVKYPRSVSIETTGKCNAACSFCPHPELERNKSSMSDELFEKIITDLEDIPREHPFTLFPNGVNEPFMDRKFIDRLKIINERLPQANIQIFTNMHVMHRDFSERIRKIKNIESINVSFYAANRAEYESVMKIDFERTVENLRQLMRLNREHQITRLPIILSRVADHSERDIAYAPQTQSLFAEFVEGVDYLIKVKNRTDWIGQIETDASPVPTQQPCGAWFDINIYCNGIVPHCCQDSEGTYSIGDASKTDVLDIYNDPQFRYLRDHLTCRGAAGTPCNQCSLFQ